MFENLFQSLQLSNDVDNWNYIWNGSLFTSKRAYCHFIGTCWSHPVFNWIWKSSCQHNHKVLFWLLSKDRLSTRNIMKRKNFQLPSFNCVLCNNNLEETFDHLFIHCDLVRLCWGLLGLMINSSHSSFQNFENFRRQLNVPFFMEIIIIMTCKDLQFQF